MVISMRRDDWFRNKTWNKEVELRFNEKLHRARDKSQYLRIQANTLAESEPKVALDLLDRYFEMGEHFDLAQAHVDRAIALLKLGQTEEAIVALENALERERRFPNVKTHAWRHLGSLVTRLKLRSRYDHVMRLLGEIHTAQLLFPADRFYLHATKAIIQHECGREAEAIRSATSALQAAEQMESGLRSHPTVGLVGEDEKVAVEEIRQILLSR